MKILVAEKIADAGIALLRQQHEVDVRKVTPAELLEIIDQYDALITRSETRVTAEVLARGTRLKVVGRAGVGVDNVDVEAATERGVVVVNVPGANTISTAEHAFGLLITLARHIPQAHNALVSGRWDRAKYVGTELAGKILGIVGLGRIGSEVAHRARAFGMKVLAYDPFVSPARAEHMGVTLLDLPALLPRVDFLTIHAAKTKESAHLIGARELAAMKPGARIINCARGGMVDEDALYDAIVAGHIGGAALDVFASEPCTEHKLFTLPQVVVTPHLSASTVEAQEANGVQIAQFVSRILAGELVPEAVNLPAVPPGAAAYLVQYLLLAEVLGSLLGQVAGGADRLQVEYTGALAEHNTMLVTNTVLKGYLGARISEAVNYINAPAVAKRRGIAVHETRVTGESAEATRAAGAPGAAGLAGAATIRVRLFREGREFEVLGTLDHQGQPRLLSFGDMPIDVAPTRHMLITRHQDRPGMVGQFGTILGKGQINIAGMHLGRKSARGEAVMVMLLDDPLDDATRIALANVPGIIEVRGVSLPALA
jgi:D-3-phosphoglycerate dehydrogenase